MSFNRYKFVINSEDIESIRYVIEVYPNVDNIKLIKLKSGSLLDINIDNSEMLFGIEHKKIRKLNNQALSIADDNWVYLGKIDLEDLENSKAKSDKEKIIIAFINFYNTKDFNKIVNLAKDNPLPIPQSDEEDANLISTHENESYYQSDDEFKLNKERFDVEQVASPKIQYTLQKLNENELIKDNYKDKETLANIQDNPTDETNQKKVEKNIIYFGNFNDTWNKHKREHRGEKNIIQGTFDIVTYPLCITYPKPENMTPKNYNKLISYELDQIELLINKNPDRLWMNNANNKIPYMLSSEIENHIGFNENDPALNYLLKLVENRINNVFAKKLNTYSATDNLNQEPHIDLINNFKTRFHETIKDPRLPELTKKRLTHVGNAAEKYTPDEFKKRVLRSLKVESQSKSDTTLKVFKNLFDHSEVNLSSNSNKDVKSYTRSMTESWANRLLDYVEDRNTTFNNWWNRNNTYHEEKLNRAGALAHDILHIQTKEDIEIINQQINLFIKDIEKNDKNSDLISILKSISNEMFTTKMLHPIPAVNKTINDVIRELPDIQGMYPQVISSETQKKDAKGDIARSHIDVAMSEATRQAYRDYLRNIKSQIIELNIINDLDSLDMGEKLKEQLIRYSTDKNQKLDVQKILGMNENDLIYCLYKTTEPTYYSESQRPLNNNAWTKLEYDLLANTTKVLKGITAHTKITLNPNEIDFIKDETRRPKTDFIYVNGLMIKESDRTLDFSSVFNNPHEFNYLDIYGNLINAISQALPKDDKENIEKLSDSGFRSDFERILLNKENFDSSQIKEQISATLIKNEIKYVTSILNSSLDTALKTYCHEFFIQNFDYIQYKEALKQRLLPGLIERNLAHPEGFILTTPAIGCLAFAGNFRNDIKPNFEKAFKELIAENQNQLNNLNAVVYTDGSGSDNVNFLGTGNKIPFISTTRKIGTAPQLDKDIFKTIAGITNEYLTYLTDNKRCSVVTAIASDALSHPGCDFNSGSTLTQEGGTAAYTDVEYILTGVQGKINAKSYTYNPPTSGNWRKYLPEGQLQVGKNAYVTFLKSTGNVINKFNIRSNNPNLKLIKNIFADPTTDMQKVERLSAMAAALYHSKNEQNAELSRSLQDSYFTAEISEKCAGSPYYQIQYFLTRLIEVETKNVDVKSKLIAKLSDLLSNPRSSNIDYLISQFHKIVDETSLQLKEKTELININLFHDHHRLRNFIEEEKNNIIFIPQYAAQHTIYSPGENFPELYEAIISKLHDNFIKKSINNNQNEKAENISTDLYLTLAPPRSDFNLNPNGITWREFSNKIDSSIVNFILQCLYYTIDDNMTGLNFSVNALALLRWIKDKLPREIDGCNVRDRLNHLDSLVYQKEAMKDPAFKSKLDSAIKRIDMTLTNIKSQQKKYADTILKNEKAKSRKYFITELTNVLNNKKDWEHYVLNAIRERGSILCNYFKLQIMSEAEFNQMDTQARTSPTLIKYDDNTYKMWGLMDKKWSLVPINLEKIEIPSSAHELLVKSGTPEYLNFLKVHQPNKNITVADLTHIQSDINTPTEQSQFKLYDSHRPRANLQTIGFSTDEIDQLSNYQRVVYDSIVFDIISNLTDGKNTAGVSLAKSYTYESLKIFDSQLSDQQKSDQQKLIQNDQILFENELKSLAKPLIEAHLKKQLTNQDSESINKLHI